MVRVYRWLLVAALSTTAFAANAATYQITSNNSGKCMSVYQGSGADNASVVQWSCVKTALDQTFAVVSLSSTTVRLVAQHTNKCLEVQNNSSANGAVIVQMTCNSSRAGQAFTRTLLSNGAYTIKTFAGFCVDVYSGGSTDGLKINQWGCNGGSNQQWKFNDTGATTPTPTPVPTATPKPTPTATPAPTPVTQTAPVISTQPVAALTIKAGESINLSVVASGNPAPSYQWKKNGQNISGKTSAALSLGNAQAADAGDYTVMVSNSVGSVTSSVSKVTVNAATPIANLYQALSNEIDKRIAGKNFGSAAVYNSQNGPAGVYVRNPNVWSAGIDLTCFSPWNDRFTNLYSVTLVSPIHVITAKHVTYPVGTKVHFVTMDNQTVVRTIAASAADPNSDIVVERLDSPVPSTIKPCRVMPSTTTMNAAGLTNVAGLPIIFLRQEENLYIRDVASINSNINHVLSTDPQRKIFTRDVIGGDSGNPMFFVLNGELAFAATHYDTTYGPYIGNRISIVNGLMNQLGGGYQLQEIPLK